MYNRCSWEGLVGVTDWVPLAGNRSAENTEVPSLLAFGIWHTTLLSLLSWYLYLFDLFFFFFRQVLYELYELVSFAFISPFITPSMRFELELLWSSRPRSPLHSTLLGYYGQDICPRERREYVSSSQWRVRLVWNCRPPPHIAAEMSPRTNPNIALRSGNYAPHISRQSKMESGTDLSTSMIPSWIHLASVRRAGQPPPRTPTHTVPPTWSALTPHPFQQRRTFRLNITG